MPAGWVRELSPNCECRETLTKAVSWMRREQRFFSMSQLRQKWDKKLMCVSGHWCAKLLKLSQQACTHEAKWKDHWELAVLCCEYIILSCFSSLPPPLSIDCSALRVSHHTGAEQEKKQSETPRDRHREKTNKQSQHLCWGSECTTVLHHLEQTRFLPLYLPLAPPPKKNKISSDFVFIFNFSLCYFKPCLKHIFSLFSNCTPNTRLSVLFHCTVGPLFHLNTNCLKLILRKCIMELISVSFWGTMRKLQIR